MGRFFFQIALAVCVAGLTPAAAQDIAPADSAKIREVQIIYVDSLSQEVVEGERVLHLFGPIHLRQDSTDLRANRAIQYVDRDEILFIGNVRIVEQGDSLAADSVLYNKRVKTGEAAGNVELSDGEVQVSAPSGFYFVREKRATFENGVTLVDSAAVLTSRRGAYWTEEKRAEFYDQVLLEEDKTTLEADSVTYFRETEVALARGSVSIERLGGEDEDVEADSTLRTFLFGEKAYNDHKTSFSRIEGNPLLLQLKTDSSGASTDTLIVRAVVLESSRQDSTERLVAVDSVRIWRDKLAAVADSVVYERRSSEGDEAKEETRLFGNPMAWFEQTQVNGDTLRITARAGSVDSLFVRGNVFVAQLDTVSAHVQQMQGGYLAGVFEQDSLRTMTVSPNAEAIYYLLDENDAPNGAVRTSGDRAVFVFEENALKQASVLGGVEGTYYAEDLIPDPFQLDRYRWEPGLRPSKSGLLGGAEPLQEQQEAARTEDESPKPLHSEAGAAMFRTDEDGAESERN